MIIPMKEITHDLSKTQIYALVRSIYLNEVSMSADERRTAEALAGYFNARYLIRQENLSSQKCVHHDQGFVYTVGSGMFEGTCHFSMAQCEGIRYLVFGYKEKSISSVFVSEI